MATITAARQTYKNSYNTTDAQCVRIVRQDGTTLRITSADIDLTMTDYIDSNGVQQTLASPVTYSSVAYKATATASGTNFEPGTVDVEGILSSAGVSRNDLLKGLYNQARIYVFNTDYTTPIEDEEKIVTGFWGEVELTDGVYTTTFRSLLDVLNTRTGKSYSPTCTARLGDSNCKVNLSVSDWAATTAYTALGSTDANVGDIVKPTTQNGWYYKCTVAGTSGGSEPTWPTSLAGTVVDGTVTWEAIYPYVQSDTVDSSANRLSFVDASRVEPDEWWTQGKVEFTSGENQGVVADIKSFDQGTTTVNLKQELPFDLAASDTYTITVGCRKRLTSDCVGKFANVDNYRGFPYMPGRTVLGKFGGQ